MQKEPVAPRSELLRSESTRDQLLNLFIEAPAAIALLVGPEFEFQLTNPRYEELMSRTHEQMAGKRLREVFPEISTDVIKLLNDVVASGSSFEAEEFPVELDWNGQALPSKRYVNMSLTPYRNEQNEIVGILAMAFDVTTQVLERRRAGESEEQLRLITDRLPALICYMGTDRRYKFVNEAYTKWFGLPRHKIEGRTRRELLGNADTADYLTPYEDKAFQGEASSFELTLTKPTGESVHLDVEYLPDRDADGHVRGMVGVGHDITQRKTDLVASVQARERVEELASELKDAVNSRDEFMSIASHELKTPITSLKLQLQLTRRQIKNTPEPVNEKLLHSVESSIKQIDRLTDLIENLLDVARTRAGRIEYKYTTFDLRELITDVTERFSEQIENSRCRLDIKEGSAVEVTWDRFRIEQVLVNMISNAIKYAPGQEIVIECQKQGEVAGFTVQDFGPGIPKERQSKIFERFERASASRNISGLGLGLFIANQIVKGHNGTILVESGANIGTKFVVEIPINPS